MNLQKIVNIIPWRLRGVIRHIPGLKQLQQHLIKRHLEGVPFVHFINAGPAKGLFYPVVLPEDKLIWIGNYEQAFSETLAAAVKLGSVCYDIGGYRGFFTGIMALQGAAAVHAFDPLPANVEQIKKMAALNPALPITVHQLALAEIAGDTMFKLMPAENMGKLDRSEFDSGDQSGGSINVTVETIDGLIAQGRMAPASLIKIDVEGAEALVLKGAGKLLREHGPVLYIEAHSHDLARQCVELLEPQGYTIRVFETGRAPDFKTEPSVCHLEAKRL